MEDVSAENEEPLSEGEVIYVDQVNDEAVVMIKREVELSDDEQQRDPLIIEETERNQRVIPDVVGENPMVQQETHSTTAVLGDAAECFIVVVGEPSETQNGCDLALSTGQDFVAGPSSELEPSEGLTDEIFECDFCNFSADLLDDLKRHMRTHSREKRHASDKYSYRAAQLGRLKKRMRRHAGEKPYDCDKCDYRGLRLEHLKDHMKTHDGKKIFACTSCDYRAFLLQDVKEHMKAHFKKETVPPGRCSCSASEMENLNHLRRTYIEDYPYVCDLCDYRGSHPGDLKNHNTKSHSRKKSYACYICNYRALLLQDVKEHVKTHLQKKTGARRCNSSPSEVGNFKYLKRTANGNKPYACDMCNHRTSSPINLKIHRRIHFGEYACYMCDYRAFLLQDLKYHEKTHLRPFSPTF